MYLLTNFECYYNRFCRPVILESFYNIIFQSRTKSHLNHGLKLRNASIIVLTNNMQVYSNIKLFQRIQLNFWLS